MLLYPYIKNEQGGIELISEQIMREYYPFTWSYLIKNKAILESREGGRFKTNNWYGYSRPQNLTRIKSPKLLCPSMAKKACFFFDEVGEWATVGSGGGGGGGYAIAISPDVSFTDLYILSILNSCAATHYFKQVSSPFRGGYFGLDKNTLYSFPIHQINFDDPAEKAVHDKLVSLADKMLGLNKKLIPVQNEYSNERDNLIREIEKKQIKK
jgi:hypothetical protein